MEKKNKKLIIIVILLIVVVGSSFAYFTSTLLFGGNVEETIGTTVTISGSSLTVEGELSFNDLDMLPGHQNVSSIKVTATGNNELIPYNVIWEGTNTLNTPLNYIVYKTEEKIEVTASCEKRVEVTGINKLHYEECSINNIESLGTPIATGIINKNETKVELASNEFITSTTEGKVIYYYVILEYPNEEENQNADIGEGFSGLVTVEKNNVASDINIIASYIETDEGYVKTTTIDTDNYVLNTEKSSCTNNSTLGWDNETKNIYVDNLKNSGTDCTLYFDEKQLASELILNNYNSKIKRTNFRTTLTSLTTGTIYYEDTSEGTTYYFAGNPTDNWLQFAGFYWRIIRINEDGSIRLIYNGSKTNNSTQINTSVFNNSYYNNMYVGFMYSNNAVYGLENSSTIKTMLEQWYEIYLMDFDNKIEKNVGFCGDRMPSSQKNVIDGNSGTGIKTTYYSGYVRLIGNNSGLPSFECTNSFDLYTTLDSNKGNNALNFPIGLISMDEVWYAGGLDSNNNSYYLYTGQDYWTMSPFAFYNNYAHVFYVSSTGSLPNLLTGIYANVDKSYGVRPVINLKANVTISSGDGTASNPYVVAD